MRTNADACGLMLVSDAMGCSKGYQPTAQHVRLGAPQEGGQLEL